MRLILLCLLSLSILSCQPKTERCENEEWLIKPYGDSLAVFALSEGMPALQRFLDSLYAMQIKDPEHLMRFYLKDSLHTPCSFVPWEVEGSIVAVTIRPRQVIEVLLNDHGQVLIEGELRSCSDLDSIWKTNVRNKGIHLNPAMDPNRAMLWLRFSSGAPVDSLAKILLLVHQAQNDIIMEGLNSKYALPFCELPGDSMRVVLEKYPLNIFLSREKDIHLPQPYVPLENQKIP